MSLGVVPTADQDHQLTSRSSPRILRLPIHPAALASAFVISSAVSNEVAWPGMLRGLLAGVGTAIVLTGAFLVPFRDLRKAALAATLVLMLLWSLDLMKSVLTVSTDLLPITAGYIVAGAVLTGAFFGAALGLIRIHRGRVPVRRLHDRANQLSLLLLLVVMLSGVFTATQHFAALGVSEPERGIRGATAGCSASPMQVLPDIYHILLDGYPRSDVLAERFAFDNQPFIDGLLQRDLVVDDHSHSNYTFTALTLSSMFNMEYLDDIPEVSALVGAPTRARTELRAAIDHAGLFSLLRRQGYRLIATPSGWEHVTVRGAVDEYLDHGEVTDFERSLIDDTWLPELTGQFGADFVVGQQLSRVTNAFADLAGTAQRSDSGPLWVYAHIPLPHLPIVFGPDGQAQRISSTRVWGSESQRNSDAQYGPGYGIQLAQLNGMVLHAIDEIRASSRGRNQVIIVMSDHGYTHDIRTVDPHDRLANLFAVAMPSGIEPLPRGTTPVNLYRYLASSYLGICLDPLPAKFFVSSPQERQIQVIPVLDPESHAPPAN